MFSKLEGGGGGLGVLPQKILKTNKAGEVISGIFRAILPSLNEQYQKWIASIYIVCPFKYKIYEYVCISLECRYK